MDPGVFVPDPPCCDGVHKLIATPFASRILEFITGNQEPTNTGKQHFRSGKDGEKLKEGEGNRQRNPGCPTNSPILKIHIYMVKLETDVKGGCPLLEG